MHRPTALVTGASRGIGRAVAVALAPTHAVAVNYSTGVEEAKQTLRMVEETGGEGVCVQADVADRAQVERCFTEVEDALGEVGIVVNNAGVRADALTLRMTDEDWHRVLAVNLHGTFYCCRRALPNMVRERWGRIVNVASIAGTNGSPGQANYAAAKAGVIGLTRTLAREVSRKGITVNAVLPGLVDTDLTADLPEQRVASFVEKTPNRRVGQPEDVSSVVAFLCSDEARHVTGSSFVVDGGITA